MAGLALHDVHAGYGAVEALHGVTMHFPLGSVVALMGRNGAGKSSVLRAITGHNTVTAGRITWEGRDLTRMSTFERVRSGVTVVPDGTNVFSGLSVADNLALFADGAPVEAAYEAFPELTDKRDRIAGTLSGGERQMVALTRLLLRPGRAILLDEAGTGLARAALDRLYGMVAELAAPDRVVVVVEQYRAEIVRRADFVYVLSRGRVAWAGEASEIASGALPLGLV